MKALKRTILVLIWVITLSNLVYPIIGKSKVWINNLPKATEPLNRDINKAQEYTKDEATGGINVEVSLDKRLLTDTKDYIKDTAKTVTDMAYTKETGVGGNIAQAAENMAKAAKNLGKAAIETITGKGKDGVLADYQGTIRNQELALQTKVNPNLKEALSNLATKPEKAEDALEKLAAKAVRANGVDEEKIEIVLYNSDSMSIEQSRKVEVLGKEFKKDEFAAFYEPNTEKIYINVAKMDGSNEQITRTLANELSHYVDAKEGRVFNKERQNVSTEYENNALKQFSEYNGNNKQTDLNLVQVFKSKINAQDFSDGNEQAGKVINIQPDWEEVELGIPAMTLKKLHYEIRDAANNAPDSEAEARKQGGILQADKNSVFHRQGAGSENNKKYLFSDGSEGVYKDGVLVTDSLNKGTYNFYNPSNMLTKAFHVIYDVNPYIPLGNTPADPSTSKHRARLLINEVKNRVFKK